MQMRARKVYVSVSNSYKNTMNLPSTSFPMRGNLPKSEPERLKKWESEHIYEAVLEKNKDGQPFVLHDGPPYANGPIHIGHAFNKILKDFVNKSKAQRGFFTPYVPGWDCHGQPIEHMVETTLGPEKMSKISQPKLRELCRDWATKYVDVQREGFKRLGINADWQHPYLTYLPNYESGNVEIFKSMYLAGHIYKGRKPIHWCKRCHTALAEAEIEYGDEVSPSIYVKFELDEMPKAFADAGATGKVNVLIWTTTPWTLPANRAVCLKPDADYVIVQADGEQFIIARRLFIDVVHRSGWNGAGIFCKEALKPVVVKGKDLCGATYTCPVREDLKGKLIYGDHVTLDTGTGCVHTAPGHGQEDYLVAAQFGIDTLMPVDDNGVLTNEAGPFAGLDTDDANPKIIEWLRKKDTLVAEQEITHSYPHCWRCHAPVIFRATNQWFVSMDEKGLRSAALNAIDSDVTFHPAWSQKRIEAMITDRPDWCISRQRSWGVPIPVFRCKECGETLATAETFDAVIDLFNTEGADAWFTKQPSEYLPENTKCEKCGCSEFEPERDILDVWWESGSSHTSVLKHRASEGLNFPAQMYLEGSDQHRGWFQSSLLTSIGAYGTPPYENILSCGFTVDEQGRKMSKSLGNGIDPADVASKYGADVLRLWVCSQDYSHDMSISDGILKQVSDAYRRFRNTFRFLLGNLNDFNIETDAVKSWKDLEPIDKYVLAKTAELLKNIEQAYDTFKFNAVYRSMYDFVNELSSVYMDVVKDRLYSEAPNSTRRRAVQTVLYNVLEVMVRVLCPILAFTTDEVWQHYPEGLKAQQNRPTNVQLAGWPNAANFVPALPSESEQAAVISEFDVLLEVRDAVTKALETARAGLVINKSQEASVNVSLPAEMYEVASKFDAAVFEELFITSGVQFSQAGELNVEVSKASGEKCPRCWNFRTLSGNANHSGVCTRCANALDEIGCVDA